MTTCVCKEQLDKAVCDDCPYLASFTTQPQILLPLSAEEYHIDFGDDFILLRKRK